MNKKFAILGLLAIIPLLVFSQHSDGMDFPPTKAFEKIFLGSSHIEAKDYLGQVNITAGTNVQINMTNGTTAPNITISATGGSGLSKIQGSNLGTSGTGIFQGNFNASMLQFYKLISANSNCVISNNSTNVILNCSSGSPGGSTLDTMENLGPHGQGVYFGNNTNTNFQFKSILANQGLTVTGNNSNVILSTNFKVNSLACTNKVLQSFNNSTGLFTCISTNDTNTAQVVNADNGQSLISSKLNATETKLMTLRNATGYLNFNHNTTSITPTFLFKANSKTCSAGDFISVIDNSTGTITCGTPSSSGRPVVLDSNLTSSSTSAFTHIWNIPLTANSGNVVTGTLVATTNTAGGAVQVGANMSSTHGQGLCTFFYGSAATTGTFFSAALGTTSSDSAWTTWLAGANVAAPVHFECAVNTDSSPPNLQLNFQAEVSSTVSIKAGSFYIKTP